MKVETPRDAWLMGGVRSGFGRFGGALADVPLVDLGTRVAQSALNHIGWTAAGIDELNFGIGMS